MDFDEWFRAILPFRHYGFAFLGLSEKMEIVSQLGTGEVVLKHYLTNENLEREAKAALTTIQMLKDDISNNDGKDARNHIKDLITWCARIKATKNIMRRRESGESQAAEH